MATRTAEGRRAVRAVDARRTREPRGASGACALWNVVAPGAIACAAACGSTEPSPGLPTPSSQPSATLTMPATGTPVSFRWDDVHGGALSSADLLDRVSVLAFVTTYDVPSQAEVRFLSQLAREHTPRINVAIVVLEPPENAPLALAFASALDLKYPVAMADAATIKGEGPFAGLHHVPSVVVLDKRGVERVRHLGLLDYAGLDAAVREVEGGGASTPGIETQPQ
jgi:hypothetical protein